MNSETKAAHEQVIVECDKVLQKFKYALVQADKNPETTSTMYKVYNGCLTVVPERGEKRHEGRYEIHYRLDGNPEVMDGLFTQQMARIVARKVNNQSQTEVFRPMGYREWLCDTIDMYECLIHRSELELTELR